MQQVRGEAGRGNFNVAQRGAQEIELPVNRREMSVDDGDSRE